MFLDFYGLREQPFGVTPDPRFLYLSPSHREAMASLYCAIENNRGFSAIVAPPGMGKTSLLFRLLETIKGKARTAFLFQPDCDSRQFMQSLLLDLGLDGVGGDVVRMRKALNRALIEERRAGRRFVLVIDEAQDLSADILESVRLLSNFETPTEKLIHIVLAGQPQLAATLRRPDMKQLSQRVSAFIGLQTFSLQETHGYVQHRLSIAGRTDQGLFTREAFEIIARASEGIPRNINSLCFQALSIGCALRMRKINSEILSEVLADLRGITSEPRLGAERTERQPAGVLALAGLPKSTPLSNLRPVKFLGSWKWASALCAAVVLPSFLWLVAGPASKMSGPASKSSEAVNAAATGDSLAESKLSSPATQATQAEGESIFSDAKPTSASETSQLRIESDNQKQATLVRHIPPVKRRESRSVNRSRATEVVPAKPRVIFAGRTETLFQIALDNYGKSGWTIVDKILAENPALRDPYTIIVKGQRVVLPDAPEVAGDTRAVNKSATGRRN